MARIAASCSLRPGPPSSGEHPEGVGNEGGSAEHGQPQRVHAGAPPDWGEQGSDKAEGDADTDAPVRSSARFRRRKTPRCSDALDAGSGEPTTTSSRIDPACEVSCRAGPVLHRPSRTIRDSPQGFGSPVSADRPPPTGSDAAARRRSASGDRTSSGPEGNPANVLGISQQALVSPGRSGGDRVRGDRVRGNCVWWRPGAWQPRLVATGCVATAFGGDPRQPGASARQLVKRAPAARWDRFCQGRPVTPLKACAGDAR